MANIELDGANKKIKVDSGDLTLDVPGDIVLDADGGDIVVADGGTNILKVTNSSSDVVLQPQVDAKDIIFKQYDGTTVATVEDNGTFNVPANKLAIGGTAVTSTAAELNIMDGVTSTAAELNILDGVTSTAAELNILDGVTATASELNLLDGGTSVGSSITLADGDGFVVNDGGTMKTIPASDISTYAGGTIVKLHQNRSTSSASVVAVNNIFDDSTYSFYRVYACIDPGSDGVEIRFRWHDSGTNELTASVYRGQAVKQYRESSSTQGSGGSQGFWGATYATLTEATSSDYYGNAFIVMDMFPRTYNEFATRVNYNISCQDDAGSPQENNYYGAFLYDANTSLDNGGFRLETSSGTIQAHDICVYGFKK